MKFWSKYVHATYSPRVAYYVMNGPHRTLERGLHAVFENNEFDSEAAQQVYGWTTEERIEVEEYLKNHADYGRTLRSLVDESELDNLEAPTREIATCLWMVTIDGDVEVCGRPAVSEDGHCVKHAALSENAPQAKPNRAKATAT